MLLLPLSSKYSWAGVKPKYSWFVLGNDAAFATLRPNLCPTSGKDLRGPSILHPSNYFILWCVKSVISHFHGCRSLVLLFLFAHAMASWHIRPLAVHPEHPDGRPGCYGHLPSHTSWTHHKLTNSRSNVSPADCLDSGQTMFCRTGVELPDRHLGSSSRHLNQQPLL